MAKTRMANWMRDKLREHAKKVVHPAAEKAALDKTYRAALPAVLALVHERYPARDMKILERYQVTSQVSKVKLQAEDGSVEEFIFEEADRPRQPNNYRSGGFYLAAVKTAALLQAWSASKASYDAELARRLTAYRALIDGSFYVDDLIDVWPEAVTVIPKAHLPLAFGPEQIAIVKRDLHERKKAAPALSNAA